MARTRTLTRILIQISTGFIGSGLGSVLAPSEAQRRLLLEAANAQLRLGGSMLAACWSEPGPALRSWSNRLSPSPSPRVSVGVRVKCRRRRRRQSRPIRPSRSLGLGPAHYEPRRSRARFYTFIAVEVQVFGTGETDEDQGKRSQIQYGSDSERLGPAMALQAEAAMSRKGPAVFQQMACRAHDPAPEKRYIPHSTGKARGREAPPRTVKRSRARPRAACLSSPARCARRAWRWPSRSRISAVRPESGGWRRPRRWHR